MRSQLPSDATSELFTSWGESAGSISVAMQMLANDGDNEGLFRGAFMQSGGPISQKSGNVEEGMCYLALRKLSLTAFRSTVL